MTVHDSRKALRERIARAKEAPVEGTAELTGLMMSVADVENVLDTLDMIDPPIADASVPVFMVNGDSPDHILGRASLNLEAGTVFIKVNDKFKKFVDQLDEQGVRMLYLGGQGIARKDAQASAEV